MDVKTIVISTWVRCVVLGANSDQGAHVAAQASLARQLKSLLLTVNPPPAASPPTPPTDAVSQSSEADLDRIESNLPPNASDHDLAQHWIQLARSALDSTPSAELGPSSPPSQERDFWNRHARRLARVQAMLDLPPMKACLAALESTDRHVAAEMAALEAALRAARADGATAHAALHLACADAAWKELESGTGMETGSGRGDPPCCPWTDVIQRAFQVLWVVTQHGGPRYASAGPSLQGLLQRLGSSLVARLCAAGSRPEECLGADVRLGFLHPAAREALAACRQWQDQARRMGWGACRSALAEVELLESAVRTVGQARRNALECAVVSFRLDALDGASGAGEVQASERANSAPRAFDHARAQLRPFQRALEQTDPTSVPLSAWIQATFLTASAACTRALSAEQARLHRRIRATLAASPQLGDKLGILKVLQDGIGMGKLRLSLEQEERAVLALVEHECFRVLRACAMARDFLQHHALPAAPSLEEVVAFAQGAGQQRQAVEGAQEALQHLSTVLGPVGREPPRFWANAPSLEQAQQCSEEAVQACRDSARDMAAAEEEALQRVAGAFPQEYPLLGDSSNCGDGAAPWSDVAMQLEGGSHGDAAVHAPLFRSCLAVTPSQLAALRVAASLPPPPASHSPLDAPGSAPTPRQWAQTRLLALSGTSWLAARTRGLRDPSALGQLHAAAIARQLRRLCGEGWALSSQDAARAADDSARRCLSLEDLADAQAALHRSRSHACAELRALDLLPGASVQRPKVGGSGGRVGEGFGRPRLITDAKRLAGAGMQLESCLRVLTEALEKVHDLLGGSREGELGAGLQAIWGALVNQARASVLEALQESLRRGVAGILQGMGEPRSSAASQRDAHDCVVDAEDAACIAEQAAACLASLVETCTIWNDVPLIAKDD